MKITYKDLLAKTERRFQPVEIDFEDGKVLKFRNHNQLPPEDQQKIIDQMTEFTEDSRENYENVVAVLRLAAENVELFDEKIALLRENAGTVVYLFDQWLKQNQPGEAKP